MPPPRHGRVERHDASSRLFGIDHELHVAVTQPSPAITVVHAVGEVDLATTPALRDTLDVQLARGPEILVVDLSQVTFLSGSGLAALDRAAGTARRHRTGLRLVACTRAVLRPLRLTALDRSIPLSTILADALHAYATPGNPSADDAPRGGTATPDRCA